LKKEIVMQGYSATPPTLPDQQCLRWSGWSGDYTNITANADLVAQYETAHTEVIDQAVAPTCSATGLTEGKHCSVCGEVIVAQEVVGATGEHIFGEWQTVKEATTAEEGLMERVCSCGEKETKIIEKIVSELAYTLNTDGQSYSVTGIGNWTDSNVIIPDTYKGLPVTSIAENAFHGYEKLTGIVIPNSITYIGPRAFKECDNITSITIPDNVTIDYLAFGWCNNLNSVTIGKNVTFNSSYAFDYCTKLASVVIGDGATSIGEYAFNECTSLTYVVIPDSVTSFEAGSFARCSALTDLTFEGTMAQWNAITKGTSWNYNTGEYTIYCADGEITKQGGITYYESLEYELSEDGTGYVVTGIGTCTDINITVPQMYNGLPVKSIGFQAFKDCTSFSSIELPDGVTTIGYGAFYGCTNLTSITIPKSLESIGGSAFYNCYKLVEIINKSLFEFKVGSTGHSYIAHYAIEVHNGETKIINQNDFLFYTYNNVNYLVAYIGDVVELTLPDSYDNQEYRIKNYAFCDCQNLSSIIIPDSITEIPAYTFYRCKNLTEIILSKNIKKIVSNAFYICTNLKRVYYLGTFTDWNNISIGSDNNSLTNSVYYYSEAQPTDTIRNYWRYVAGFPYEW
jgi:hypothetical protein